MIHPTQENYLYNASGDIATTTLKDNEPEITNWNYWGNVTAIALTTRLT
jgi:YD repeat-containing protein